MEVKGRFGRLVLCWVRTPYTQKVSLFLCNLPNIKTALGSRIQPQIHSTIVFEEKTERKGKQTEKI